jgi:uncharacterized protein YecE (DUF72 family)
MKFDAERFEDFFALLPRTHKQAATLGKQHSERLNGRVWLRVQNDRPLRHAVEIRNESFVCEEFIALLRKYRIGLVCADTVEWPRLMDLTADFVYCRLHGDKELYTSGYDEAAIEEWAQRVFRWTCGEEVEDGMKASAKKGRSRATRDVFVYFDNDSKVRAPGDAQSLRRRIEQLMRGGAALGRDADRR